MDLTIGSIGNNTQKATSGVSAADDFEEVGASERQGGLVLRIGEMTTMSGRMRINVF